MHDTWGSIDRSGDPQAYVDYLRAVSATEAAQKYKRLTFRLMSVGLGNEVLDVGCGRGDEVVALARIVGEGGRAAGIDASEAMIAEARRRANEAGVRAEFKVGDAESLPFPDGSFDAARIDRTLQHLGDPDRALRELRRVCRPGGRVVAAEPDWGSLIVDGDDEETTRVVIGVHNAHVAHGLMGRELWRRFLDAGFEDLLVEPFLGQMTDLRVADPLLGLHEAADEAVGDGLLERARADRWLDGLRAANERGRFFSALAGFIVSGRNPAG